MDISITFTAAVKCKEHCSNIHFLWRSGMSTPDHNTINRFSGERLKEPLKIQVVHLLAREYC